MKIRLDGGVVRGWLIGVGLLAARPGGMPAWIGAGLVGLGLLAYLWGKGCLGQGGEVTVCGPYRWSRHPMHLTSLLIDFGLCLVINCLWLTVPFLVVWAVVHRREIVHEERELQVVYGQGWEEYKRGTSVFWPYKRARRMPTGQSFSWSNPNLWQGSGLPYVICAACYPLLLVVAGHMGPRMWITEHTANLAWLGTASGAACAAGVVSLWLVAAVLEQQLQARQAVLPEALHRHSVQLGLMLAYLFMLAVSTAGFHRPEPTTVAIGMGLLVLGFYALRHRRGSPVLAWNILAWCGALGAAGLLAGLVWAMILAIAGAIIVCIDVHMGDLWGTVQAEGTTTAEQPAAVKPLWDRVGMGTYYMLFSLAVLAIALGKARS